jgi:hypothetical protein
MFTNIKLLKKINDLIESDRDSIIKECGYEINKQLDYVNFYTNFLDALGLNKANRDSDYLYEKLIKNRYASGPMLDDDNIIYGRYTFRISDSAFEKEWDEDSWDEDNVEGLVGPFEIGNPNGSKGYFYAYYDYESAIDSNNLPDQAILDYLRPCYLNLTGEHEGVHLSDYLKEYGEHPKELIEISSSIN